MGKRFRIIEVVIYATMAPSAVVLFIACLFSFVNGVLAYPFIKMAEALLFKPDDRGISMNGPFEQFRRMVNG